MTSDATEGAGVAAAVIAWTIQYADVDAGDLPGKSATHRAIDLRVVFPGVADENESSQRKRSDQCADPRRFAAAAEHQNASQQMIAETKRSQVKCPGRKAFVCQVLRQMFV